MALLAATACGETSSQLPSEAQVLSDARAEWGGRVGITGMSLEWIRADPADDAVAYARLKLEGPGVHDLARLHVTYARTLEGWRASRLRIRELRD
ncbi:hypothetical protein [Anaeromyxobacter paludicola]|uniref:hypothetical protein n=1 Tax=Anaeromyxobacter paludicola TaxID=2918171 RepID=UPI0020BF76CF|nr:hypothetical protein [Anaeromyxobacter paludicola]